MRHYAGEVTYNTAGWLEKNRGALAPNLVQMMVASEHTLLSELFDGDACVDISDAPSSTTRVSGRDSRDATKPPPLTRGGGGGKKSASTVLGQFRASLRELFEVLQRTSARYIRCLKPNAIKSPSLFDGSYVERQLLCNGVLAIVEVQAAGYSLSLPKAEFLARYSCCARLDATEQSLVAEGLTHARTPTAATAETVARACTALMHAAQRTLREGGGGGDADEAPWLETADAALGHTKVFVRERVVRRLEVSRDAVAAIAAATMQRSARVYLARVIVGRVRQLRLMVGAVRDAAGAAMARRHLQAFDDTLSASFSGLSPFLSGWMNEESTKLHALVAEREAAQSAAEKQAEEERAVAEAAERAAAEKVAAEKAAAERAAAEAAAAEVAANGIIAADAPPPTTTSDDPPAKLPANSPPKPKMSVMQRAHLFSSGEDPAGVTTANGANGHAGACDDYKIDMTAATFGTCRCGRPKSEHKQSAAPAAKRPRAAWKPPQMPLHSSDGPKAAVSMRHPRFGRPVDARVNDMQTKVAARVEEAVVDAVVKAAAPDRTSTTDAAAECVEVPPACDSYQLDMAGKNFGDCKCGRPKREHTVSDAPRPSGRRSVGVGLATSERAAMLGAMFNPAMLAPGGRPKATKASSREDVDSDDSGDEAAAPTIRGAVAGVALPGMMAARERALPTVSEPADEGGDVGGQSLAVLKARPAGAAGRRRGKPGARAGRGGGESEP